MAIVRRLAIVVVSGTFSIQAACASSRAFSTAPDVRARLHAIVREVQELRALRRGECGEQF
jgi:hypothetical protein